MSVVNYEQSITYLNEAARRKTGCGLEKINKWLALLGDPQDCVPIIHVAGTNGKGSVCAFLGSVLQAAGYTVGTFTSPHLQRVNERITINLQAISNDDFARLLTRVADKLPAADIGEPIFFEIVTVMAFTYFVEMQVDFAIIETGIGGRLDTTNVVSQPMLSVITSISYDHMELLGDTLPQIAGEKAGIIKENGRVALYPTETADIFIKTARQKNAKLYYTPAKGIHFTDVTYTLCQTLFSVETAYFTYQSLTIRLLGQQQLYNAALALLCVHALRESGVAIAELAVYTGFDNARWPGRFELIQGMPTVVLDGAHNEDGARCFTTSLDLYFNDRPVVLVAGLLKTKDAVGIMRWLSTGTSMLICTQPSNQNALPAETLASHVNHEHLPVKVEPDYKKAFRMAKEAAGSDGVVAIAGSLYLIGDIKLEMGFKP